MVTTANTSVRRASLHGTHGGGHHSRSEADTARSPNRMGVKRAVSLH